MLSAKGNRQTGMDGNNWAPADRQLRGDEDPQSVIQAAYSAADKHKSIYLDLAAAPLSARDLRSSFE